MAKKQKTTKEKDLKEEPTEAKVLTKKETGTTTENGQKASNDKASKRSKKLNSKEKLEREKEELLQQVGELKDKYLRLFAEFENFRKRSIREKLDMIKNASQDTLSSLLPVLDDFDRAKKNAEDENSAEPFSEGVNLVYSKLYNLLKLKGLEPMVTTGEPFDPELHEAVTEIPAPSDDLKGKIIDTIETGYKLNDKIIRHAKVVVGK